jgi:uroporphyrinogen decarboxylase
MGRGEHPQVTRPDGPGATAWAPRDRVLAAIRHTEPDRVPFDLGSTPVTGIHRQAYVALRAELGLPPRDPITYHMMQQLAVVEDDVHAALATDARGARARPPNSWRLEETEADGFRAYTDEWGIVRRMPVDRGLYFDLAGSPLADARTVADVERHPWPSSSDPARFVGLREALISAREGGFATVLGGISSGMMEMGEALRGFGAFFEDLAAASPVTEAIVERVLELKMAYWQEALDRVGDLVDIVQEGDDLGGQTGLLISPRTFATLFRPRLARLFGHIKLHAPHAAIFYHSCGSVRRILPDLIEIGANILNPVQVSARDMDTRELKKLFGRDITFWGGGVDTQAILPNGTPAEVREEVRRRIGDLAPGGGFVFSAVHNIQADAPTRNVVAMREALAEFGSYG